MSIRIPPFASGPSPERGLLDTSVAIAIGSIEFSRLPAISVISCLTLAELQAGPFATRDLVERLRRQRHIKHLEAQAAMLPFESAAAGAYGRVHAAVSAIGRKPRGPRAIDLMIAATACAHGLPLYTLNASDLRGLETLVEIVDLSR